MAHNGKKLAINLYYLINDRAFPFLNNLKTMQQFNTASPFGAVDPATLDSKGWPLSTAMSSGGVQAVLYLPLDSRGGQYKFIATGNGTVQVTGGPEVVFSGGATVQESSTTFTPTAPETPGQVIFYIKATGDDTTGNPHLTDIALVHVDDGYYDDLTQYKNGKTFQKGFLDVCKQFGAIRPMNYMRTNESSWVSWDDRTPVDYASYLQARVPASIYTATVSNSGNDYTATLAGVSSYTDKLRIIWKCPASYNPNTLTITNITHASPCTISATNTYSAGQPIYLSNTLPAPLKDTVIYYVVNPTGSTFQVAYVPGGAAIGTTADFTGPATVSSNPRLQIGSLGLKSFGQGGSGCFSLATGEISSCVFDSDLDCWVLHRDEAISAGVPPEVMIELCNEVGAHLWSTMPFLAADAAGDAPTPATIPDYTEEFATYYRDNHASGLKLIWEGVNECWNSGFDGTTYACLRELKRNGYTSTGDFNNWYGMNMSLSGQVLNSVFSGDTSQYAIMVGCHKLAGVSGSTDRFESSLYVAQSGGDSSLAAVNFATHVCCDGYWMSKYFGSSEEVTWAGPPATNLDTYVNACSGIAGVPNVAYTIDDDISYWQDFNTYAVANGLKQSLYEEGYGPLWAFSDGAPGTPVGTYRQLSMSRSEVTTQTLLAWDEFLAMPNTEFPGVFVMSGEGNYGLEVIFPDVYTTTTPRWQAVLQFNAEHTINIGDYVLDNGLASLNTLTDKVLLCTTQPTDYAAAVSLAIGNKTGTGIFGTPTSGTPSGQKVSLNVITDGTITTAGSVTWWAAVDSSGSNLLASGPVDTPRSVTTGNFSLGSFDITLLAS